MRMIDKLIAEAKQLQTIEGRFPELIRVTAEEWKALSTEESFPALTTGVLILVKEVGRVLMIEPKGVNNDLSKIN